MNNKYSFSDEIVEKFQDFDSKLYNIKYCLEMYMNYLEDETHVPLPFICMGLIIKSYFNNAKEEFVKLEEDLDVLI